jgi:ABC-type nitrate/sulfonate/bicarbonate transport system permease component
MRRYQKQILNVASIVAVLLLWLLLSNAGLLNPMILPSPVLVFETFITMLSNGTLFLDIGISAARIFLGFTAAFFIAVPLGLLCGKSELAENIFNPWIKLLQPIPSVAWVPFALLALGANNTAAVFVIGLAAFFPIFINTMNGVMHFDKDLIDSARNLGAGNLQVVAKVLLPGLVPELIAGSRIGIGFAWRAVVAAEMIGVPLGIGSLLMSARTLGDMDQVLVSMITLGILMMLFDRVIFEAMEKGISRWKGNPQEE